MFEKKKNLTVYAREKLQKMQRPQLNTVALQWGLVPHDSLADEDLIDEIVTQQAARLQEMDKEEKDHVANPEAIKEAQARSPVAREPAKPKAVAESKTRAEERVWIRIAAGSTALEKGDVFANLNGDNCLIKRGEWVRVKKKFLNLFNDAIVTQVEIDKDDNKILRHVPRFNIAVRSLEQGVPTRSGDVMSSF